MRGRLAVPAALGVLVVVACVAGGIHRRRAAAGLRPRRLRRGLGGPGPGALGAGCLADAPGRPAPAGPGRPGRLARAGRSGQRRDGRPHRRGGHRRGPGGGHRVRSAGDLVLAQGGSGTFAGHSVEFVGTRIVRSPAKESQQALLRVDGGSVFTPAISQFGTGTQAVGTPAIDSSLTSDVYLTINSIPAKGGSWTFGVVVQPLVMWLWVGGALVVVGLGPVRRPRPPPSAHRPGVDPGGAAAPPGPRRTPSSVPTTGPVPTGRHPHPGGSRSAPGKPRDRAGPATRRRRSTAPAPVRRRHTARWIAVGVLVVAAGLIAVLATRPPAAVAQVQSPLVGGRPRRCRGPRWTGTASRLPRPPGTYVVLNFFASWCEPCQTEGPDLVQFAFEHQRSGDARVVSVVFDDTDGRRPLLPGHAGGHVAHPGRPQRPDRPRLRRPGTAVDVPHRTRRPGGGLHRGAGHGRRPRRPDRQGQGGRARERAPVPAVDAARRRPGGGPARRQRCLLVRPAHRRQRAAAIESVIRCPSCEDLSVAVSSAPTAVTVRATVTSSSARACPTSRSRTTWPPATARRSCSTRRPAGWSILVWSCPWPPACSPRPALVVVLVRRRRRGGGDPSTPTCRWPAARPRGGRGAAAVPHPVAGRRRRRIPGRRPQRRRLPGPPPAGHGPPGGPRAGTRRRRRPRRPPPGRDHGRIRDGPTGGRIRRTRRSRADRGHPRPGPRRAGGHPPPRRRRSRNKWFLVAALGCFVAALVVAVPVFSSHRLPGQTATGSVSPQPEPADGPDPRPGRHRGEPGPARAGRPALPAVLDRPSGQRGGPGPAGMARVSASASRGPSATLLVRRPDQADRGRGSRPG